MRVGFIGKGLEICELCKRLGEDGHSIISIATYPQEAHQIDRQEHESERQNGLYRSVFEFAEAEGIDLLETADFNSQDAIDWIATRKPELLVSWRPRSILSDQFVAHFESRIINMHIGTCLSLKVIRR